MKACNFTQATRYADVCGTMCLQAACKLLLTDRPPLSWRHSAISRPYFDKYHTWFKGAGSTGNACL